jgi:hypothetical protein
MNICGEKQESVHLQRTITIQNTDRLTISYLVQYESNLLNVMILQHN